MHQFKFITHDIRDAYFNLASEEYLLKHTDGFYFYLWINNPAVIVGVNQNTIEEVNLKHTEAHHVKVVRRLTGGGAVYHDGGNLCYTVIAPYTEGENYYKPTTTFDTTLKDVKEDISGQASGTTPSWFVYFGHSSVNTLPGTAWGTQWTNMNVLINNTEQKLVLKNGGGNCFYDFDIITK